MGRVAPLVGDAPGDPGARAAGQPDVIQVPLTVAAVASRLGVAPSTLRTWDRRYGLGPSGRSAGSHRRYTAEDVARLDVMRRLTLAGAAPADAARAAVEETPGAASSIAVPRVVEPAGSQPRVDALTLAAAAIKGDEHRVRRLLASAVRGWGIVDAWTEVVQPAFAYLEERDGGDRPGRDPAHMLAAAVLATARSLGEGVDSGPKRVVVNAEPALVTNRLGADVLAAALAGRGVRAVVLRGPADRDRVLRALDSADGVLAIVGTSPGGERLAREVSERGGIAVIVVGAEAPAVWLPEVQRVRTFAGAVHEIVGALGSGAGPDPSESRGGT